MTILACSGSAKQRLRKLLGDNTVAAWLDRGGRPAILRDSRAGLSTREFERKHHVGWHTVQATVQAGRWRGD